MACEADQNERWWIYTAPHIVHYRPFQSADVDGSQLFTNLLHILPDLMRLAVYSYFTYLLTVLCLSSPDHRPHMLTNLSRLSAAVYMRRRARTSCPPTQRTATPALRRCRRTRRRPQRRLVAARRRPSSGRPRARRRCGGPTWSRTPCYAPSQTPRRARPHQSSASGWTMTS